MAPADESKGAANTPPAETQAKTPPKKEGWTPSREATLVFATGVLIVFFTVTAFASRFYHETQRSLARHWYARGEAALASGHSVEAAEDFRTALVYSRENGDKTGSSDAYEFELAKALAAQGQIEQARAYLFEAAERKPGNAEVNLELARLSARQGNVDEASRYFNAAIFGAWQGDPAERRRAARIEYFEFLLSHGERAEAQAQAIAIAGGVPPDAGLYDEAGGLLLRSGANDQALSAFQRSLSLRRTAEAAGGAGVAAFRTANYREAERYLAEAVRLHDSDPEVRELLGTAQLVVALDPFVAGLTVNERAQRASRDFSITSQRFESCQKLRNSSSATTGSLSAIQSSQDELKKTEPLAAELHLKMRPDDLNTVMLAVFSIESGLTQACGPPQDSDAALQLIAKNRAGIVQP